MSRKRICEDCGNICNDERCPICGRKTKVYTGSFRQEDTLYDASKYRVTDNRKSESDIFEQKKERIDDDEKGKEQRYHHTGGKHLRLRMEKGGHPYYEHVKGNDTQKNILLVRLFGILLMIAVVVAIVLISVSSDKFRDDDPTSSNREDIEDGFVSGNISKQEVDEEVTLTCTVMDYESADGAQVITTENKTPYLVKTDLMKGDDFVGYLSLPAHSKTEYLIYDENLSACKNRTYGVYEMDIEKPQIEYVFTSHYKADYTMEARIDLKEEIDMEQLEILMRYLYAQVSESYMYDISSVSIYHGDSELYEAFFDFTQGIIQFGAVDASNTPSDIYIEN